MIAPTILLLGLLLIDIPPMLKRKRIKDMVLLLFFAIITWVFAFYYQLDPYGKSLSNSLLDLFQLS